MHRTRKATGSKQVIADETAHPRQKGEGVGVEKVGILCTLKEMADSKLVAGVELEERVAS